MFIAYFVLPVLFLPPSFTVIIIVQEMMRRVRRLWLISLIYGDTRRFVRHSRARKMGKVSGPGFEQGKLGLHYEPFY